MGPELALNSKVFVDKKVTSWEPGLTFSTLYGQKWALESGVSYYHGVRDSAEFDDDYNLLSWHLAGGIFVPTSANNGVKLLGGWFQEKLGGDLPGHNHRSWGIGCKLWHSLGAMSFFETGIWYLRGQKSNPDVPSSNLHFKDISGLKLTISYLIGFL